MNKLHFSKTHAAAMGLLLFSTWAPAQQAQPDNTKVNQRDRNPDEATADRQKTNPEDQALTAKIRRAIIADKSLSTYAHNVKIVSQNGIVTLKGPVNSDDEAKTIMALASDAAGSAGKVVNQMSVKP